MAKPERTSFRHACFVIRVFGCDVVVHVDGLCSCLGLDRKTWAWGRR